MSQKYVLEVDNLVKKFGPPVGGFFAVSDISFDLKEGEILGFLGPNGAGKTTTIQMLLGILTPTSGRIHYFGKDLNQNHEEILEKVNFSSTYTNLPWRLKVKEALFYSSYLYNISFRKRRLEKIANIFRLERIWNQEIAGLSSGQLTRLNLAKAFLNFPRVLLLDEPTASLDPESADYIRQFLMNQRKEFGVSILFTSHNMPEVTEVCDRVIFIQDGKIFAEDTPENLPKRIKKVRLTLGLTDGFKRTVELLNELKLKHEISKRNIQIEINEKEISTFLNKLAEKQIVYAEISIEKPTLEDFFLEVVRNAK